ARRSSADRPAGGSPRSNSARFPSGRGMLSLREPVPISHTQRCPASLLTIALIGASSHKVRSAMSTMKAVRAHKRGGPEVLRYEDAPVPEVGTNEVLVEVNAVPGTSGEFGWDGSGQSSESTD